MRPESSHGELATIPCTYCHGIVFFIFKGGPQQVPCPDCERVVSFEVVFDGTRWRTKPDQRPCR